MNLKLLFNIFVLLANQKKTAFQIQKLQEKKLRRILKYAYNNSEYYKNAFEQKGINKKNISFTPLSAFPILEKNTFIENFSHVVTKKDITQEKLRMLDEGKNRHANLADSKIHFVHSSGSTGIPRYFYYDDSAWNMMLAGIIRSAFWGENFLEMMSFVRKGARLCYIAAVDGNYGGAASIQSGIRGMNASQLFIDLNTPVSEWLPKIQNFNPNLLIGYPSALKILAELLESENLQNENKEIQQIITCGEPLTSSCRAYLEKVFNKQIINFYGTSESLALGLEKNPSDKMILFDDLNYIEEIDGLMYLTCLYNFSQPLIRYKITDRIRLIEKSDYEKSRIPFSRCSVVQSREEDVMWFSDGKSREFLHPLSVEGFCIQGLLDYQFVQKNEKSFIMLLQLEQKLDAEKREAIFHEMKISLEKILSEKRLDFVSFNLETVDEIHPESNGKKKLIVRCA